MTVRLTVTVQRAAPGWSAAEAATARRAARAALLAAGAPKGAGLDLLLADDATLRALNRRFRGKDAPTNVLSFPAPPGAGSLGDVALARETLEREAAEEGRELSHHLAHLAVHGAMHLMGFDHEDEAGARDMEARETAVLAGLGVPDPYAERDDCAGREPLTEAAA